MVANKGPPDRARRPSPRFTGCLQPIAVDELAVHEPLLLCRPLAAAERGGRRPDPVFRQFVPPELDLAQKVDGLAQRRSRIADLDTARMGGVLLVQQPGQATHILAQSPL